MAEKPILFNTEMVRAILSGRKTQTRRIVKPQPKEGFTAVCDPYNGFYEYRYGAGAFWKTSLCAIDDVLWVRETWAYNRDRYLYKADYPENEGFSWARWHPSIHMPRQAARIFLRVKDVRVERLQDMSDKDAQEEGIGKLFLDAIAFGDKDYGCMEYIDYKGWLGMEKEQFAHLWDTTIKKADLPLYGWDANPWVWVISFERIER